jgi:hypothetical protein
MVPPVPTDTLKVYTPVNVGAKNALYRTVNAPEPGTVNDSDDPQLFDVQVDTDAPLKLSEEVSIRDDLGVKLTPNGLATALAMDAAA